MDAGMLATMAYLYFEGDSEGSRILVILTSLKPPSVYLLPVGFVSTFYCSEWSIWAAEDTRTCTGGASDNLVTIL